MPVTAATTTSTDGTLGKDRLERTRDVASRKLRRGDLVQQGLELVIVVAVDERDGQPCLDESLRAADSGEPSTDDNGCDQSWVHLSTGCGRDVLDSYSASKRSSSAFLGNAKKTSTAPSSTAIPPAE